MPRLTDAGFVRTTKAQYNTRMLDVFRAGLGQDMQTGADTIQGIFARAGAAIMEVWDAEAMELVQGMNPSTMVRFQLDNLAVGFQLTRKAATKSTGTVTLTGASGTVIPEGSEVRTAEGDIFVTDSEATVPASGTVDVAVTAEEFGVIQAAADTITVIIDNRPGWTGVTNAAAVTVGRQKKQTVLFAHVLSKQGTLTPLVQ